MSAPLQPPPLDRFLEETRKAPVDQFLPAAEEGLVAAGRDAEAAGDVRDFAAYQIARMKDYYEEFYRGVTSARVFVDPGGGAVDCVPRTEQPTARAAVGYGHALRPAPAGSSAAGKKTPLGAGRKDPLGTPRECPPGTTPLRRVPLATMARFGHLDEFLLPGRGARPPDGPGGRGGVRGPAGGKERPGAKGFWDGSRQYYHRHAFADSSGGPFYGCQGWFNVWAPDPRPGVFSLGQLWLVRPEGAWGGGRQTIESGWQVYPEMAGGAGLPYLFVFTNPDNYGGRSGYAGRTREGFIYYDNPGWAMGVPLDAGFVTAAEDRDNQMGVMMRWAAYDNGDWELWVGVNEAELQAVGYVPGAFYGPGRPGQPFDTLQFGGEVSARSESAGRMGSLNGRRPTGTADDDFGRVAHIKYLAAQYRSGGDFQDVTDFRAVLPDEQQGYTCSLGQSPRWGRYLFFGGPNG